MDQQTVTEIKAVLLSSLRRTLHRRAIDEPYDPDEFRRTSPFHARLVPDEIWRASKFERSFVTSIGQGVFEQVAVVIAKSRGYEAAKGHKESGEIWTGQLTEIHNILENLRANKSKPDWFGELTKVNEKSGIGEKRSYSITSDLYIRRPNDHKYFYSLKTVKPNIDQTEKAKSDSLILKAMDVDNTPFFALPYNPYINRKSYKWTHPFKVFDMLHDPCVLIGEEFWQDVGGEGTYATVLNIFEEVGDEFAPQIRAYLDGLS